MTDMSIVPKTLLLVVVEFFYCLGAYVMKITSYKKNGKTYYKFNAYLGLDEYGKEIRTNRQGFTTKKDAEIEFLRLKEKGLNKKTTVLTLDDAYQEWISSYKLTVRGSTLENTVAIYKNHIQSLIGKKKIDTFTTSFMQQFINDISKKTDLFSRVKSILSRIFDMQVRNKNIPSNPCKDIILPKKQAKSDEKIENFYNKDELTTFLKLAIEQLPFKYYVFFHLLAFTGMRRGEALALLKSDIDTENKQLFITKTLSRNQDSAKVINATKTSDGNRVIDIDDNTLTLLIQLMKTNDGDILFIDENSNYIHLSTPIKYLDKLVKDNDLKRITVHGLRHTHCSLLFEAGATVKEVQHRLGHKDIKTTLDIYTHLTKNQKVDTVNKFLNFINQS